VCFRDYLSPPEGLNVHITTLWNPSQIYLYQANQVFYSVYIAGQVLKRLLQQHPDKVQGQQAISKEKARLIYGALEAYPDIYRIIPDKTVRSRMNICFRIKGGDAAEEAFLEEGAALGLTGLKGHRSLGGIRASNYNAVPLEGAEKLANFIGAFASRGITTGE
jgi:phosphoserine aminotransferase